MQLWNSEYEDTAILKYAKGFTEKNLKFDDVFEIFVVKGSVKINGDWLEHNDWLRLPKNTTIDIEATDDCIIYNKVGKGYVWTKE